VKERDCCYYCGGSIEKYFGLSHITIFLKHAIRVLLIQDKNE